MVKKFTTERMHDRIRSAVLRVGAQMVATGVAKNAWWTATCPIHGETQHMAAIGGRCVECQKEGLEHGDVQDL